MIGGSGRGSTFGQQWMTDNFGQQHQKEVGVEIKKGGYPDCGSGRYIIKAGYEKWLLFMSNQRIHGHYLEAIQQILVMVLVSGLQFPIETFYIGCVYLVARIMF